MEDLSSKKTDGQALMFPKTSNIEKKPQYEISKNYDPTPNNLELINRDYLSFSKIYEILLQSKSIEQKNIFFNSLINILRKTKTTKKMATSLFNLAVHNLSIENKDSSEDFLSFLSLDKIFELYNKRVKNEQYNLEAEIDYFVHLDILNYIGKDKFISIQNELKYKEILDEHTRIQNTILECFEYKDEIKLHLGQKVYESLLKHREKETYNILTNVVFNDVFELTLNEKIGLQNILIHIDDTISDSRKEDSFKKNLIKSLINKDKRLLSDCLNKYIRNYEIGLLESQDKVTEEDILQLFTFSLSAHEEKSVIDIFFTYYDEELFKFFVENYNIPSNFTILKRNTTWSNEESIYLSLIDLALHNKQYHIAQSLINLGFHLETTSEEEVLVFSMQDKPLYQKILKNILHYTEEDFILLIKNGLIDSNTSFDTIEVLSEGHRYDEDEEEENYDKEVVSEYNIKNNNIFFYLLYKNYNIALLLLYYNTKKKDPSFSLKDLSMEEKDREDLLVYYLKLIQIYKDFNTEILDIFIEENYKIKNQIIRNKILGFLSNMSINLSSQIVFYLNSIFSELDKKEISQEQETSSSHTTVDTENNHDQSNLVSWIDIEGLKSHYKKVTSNKDNFNSNLIKNIIENRHYLKEELIIKDEYFFEQLKEEFPNFEEVINFYKSQFRLRKISKKRRITPIILLGEPGIGKTYFSKKLARYLNTGYTFIDMASLTANWILTGANSTWKSAKEGKILEAMISSNTISPIVLMDEIEKSRNGENDPTMALYQLLEEVNAKSFTDEFLDFSFDASNIIYIACANTLGNLSEPLLSRFKIFDVRKPTDEQFVKIIHNIYKEAIKSSNLFDLSLSNEIVDLLKAQNIRSAKIMIDDAIGNVMLELDMDSLENREPNDLIKLELRHFESPIKKKPMGFF